MKRLMFLIAAIFILLVAFGRSVLVERVDRSMNVVLPHAPFATSEAAKALHKTLIVGDWHADTTLWERNMEGPHGYGQVDLARLQAGNVGLQMFTSVTKSPAGQNYERNETSARDNITTLAVAQLWPIATWQSLTARAAYQAERVHELQAARPDDFMVITSQTELATWQARRSQNPDFVGGLIGSEGAHALDGELENIELLAGLGLRMMGLQHFFDNKLGGSLHGTSGAGLTEFGKAAVSRLEANGIIVDVAHSSEQTVRDVLAMATRPVVVSHTGFKGHCNTARNIADTLMQDIAAAGGLIAVGYWDGAVCGESPAQIVDAIEYGIELVGADHIALGSDYDGTITAAFDTSELAVLTQEMLQRGLAPDVIRQVMGGNMLRFLSVNLPK